jgi:hypothetical protein
MNLKERMAEMRRDLLNPAGPQISTMGNFPFAILQYDPEDEFLMREQLHKLVDEMSRQGWSVRNISLLELMLRQLRTDEGEAELTELIAGEKRIFTKRGIKRSLNHLQQVLAPDLEGPEGLAEQVIQEIQGLLTESRSAGRSESKTLIFLSRVGALYPFYRASGLLRYLDGKTGHVPVILLYPGTRHGTTSLSFMGVCDPDSDYRPRIY